MPPLDHGCLEPIRFRGGGRHAHLLRFGGSQSVVQLGVCWGVRARIGLWFLTGCVAVRLSRVRMNSRSGQPMAREDA